MRTHAKARIRGRRVRECFAKRSCCMLLWQRRGRWTVRCEHSDNRLKLSNNNNKSVGQVLSLLAFGCFLFYASALLLQNLWRVQTVAQQLNWFCNCCGVTLALTTLMSDISSLLCKYERAAVKASRWLSPMYIFMFSTSTLLEIIWWATRRCKWNLCRQH